MKKIIISILLGISLTGIWWVTQNTQVEPKGKLVMYKPANCGCCEGHKRYLQSKGYQIEVIEATDMSKIKDQFGVPKNIESCHTLVGDNYFIEGHVPVKAIDKLLQEKPDIQGIGLAGMPSGSPGMPGKKKAPFEIFSIDKNLNTKEWLEI